MSDCEFPLTFPWYLGGCGTTLSESLVSQYQDQAIKLLPPGRGITKLLQIDGVDTCNANFLKAFAVEYARVHERGADLYRESFPGDATDAELLTDWETLVGLPNDCTAYLVTEADRQAAVLGRMATEYTQSQGDFESLGTDAGYDIEIGSYGAWHVGHSTIADPLQDTDWYFAARVSYEAVGTTADEVLECTLSEHAHIYGVINYNAWDDTDTTASVGINHHYVHGEFVFSGSDITEWTNRISAANSWAGGGTPPTQANASGWRGVMLWDGNTASPTFSTMTGLNHAQTGSEDADTLIKEDDFGFVIVFQIDEAPGVMTILSDSADFTLFVNLASGQPQINLTYGTVTVTEEVDVGVPVAVLVSADGSNVLLRVNGDTANVSGVYTSTVSGTQALTLGGDFRGSVIEMYNGDSDPSISAAYTATVAKYIYAGGAP